MGPPEFTGGNGELEANTDATDTLLQWDRRNSPAETDENVGGMGAAITLQWGRRNSPAETSRNGHGGDHRRRRFNGAAGIHRRKPMAVVEDEIADTALQWGRRNSPAETPAQPG